MSLTNLAFLCSKMYRVIDPEEKYMDKIVINWNVDVDTKKFVNIEAIIPKKLYNSLTEEEMLNLKEIANDANLKDLKAEKYDDNVKITFS